MFGVFKPIKINEKEFTDELDRLKNRRKGFKKMIIDLAEARQSIEDDIAETFEKIEKKYKIPKRYRGKLEYWHQEHELRLKE